MCLPHSVLPDDLVVHSYLTLVAKKGQSGKEICCLAWYPCEEKWNVEGWVKALDIRESVYLCAGVQPRLWNMLWKVDC